VLPYDTPEWSIWLIIILSVILGIGTGYITAKYQAVGFVLLGVWLGTSFTLVLENFVIRGAVAGFVLYRVWYKQRTIGIVLAAGLLIIPSISVIYTTVVISSLTDA